MEEATINNGVYVPLEEQETHINYSRLEKFCTIWTSDSTTITKLDKLCESSPDYYKLVNVGKYKGKVVNKEYQIADKTLISFRSGKIKRELTEEQRKALSERAKERFTNKA